MHAYENDPWAPGAAPLEQGMALYAQGRRAEGVALYRRALRLEPGNVLAHFLLGLSLMAEQRDAEARQEWEAVLSLPARGERAAWAQRLAVTLLERYVPVA